MEPRKNIILVGASGGIGKEISSILLADGHTVYKKTRMNSIDWNYVEKTDFLIFANGYGEFAPFGKNLLNHRKMYEDNLESQIDFTDQVLRISKNIKHIIYIVSNSAYEAFPNNTVYGATKAGLLHFARALWKEVGKDGIKVTTISPGTVNTDSFWAKAGRDNREYCYPLDPKEIAKCVKFALECEGNILEMLILPKPK